MKLSLNFFHKRICLLYTNERLHPDHYINQSSDKCNESEHKCPNKMSVTVNWNGIAESLVL